MANLKDGIESLVKEATKESKPAPKLTPAEEGEKAARQENAENFAKALKNVKRTPAEEGILQAKQDARENKKPAPWKYTPFKLDTKKYADVKQTPYGYIYNVDGESITDLNAQNRHFAKNDPSFKFDKNKDYGFSRTAGGDEVLHTTFDEAYQAIKNKNNKAQPESYGSKEDGYEGSPMKEFSGPEDSDLSYAQQEALKKDDNWKRYFSGDVVEDYGNRAIVQLANSGKYVLWSKTNNRPISTMNKNNELIPMEYGSVDELKKDERLRSFLPEKNEIDTKHGDVKNAPFVVDADGEKFAFDTEREADSFIERNKYSYSSLKKQPQPKSYRNTKVNKLIDYLKKADTPQEQIDSILKEFKGKDLEYALEQLSEGRPFGDVMSGTIKYEPEQKPAVQWNGNENSKVDEFEESSRLANNLSDMLKRLGFKSPYIDINTDSVDVGADSPEQLANLKKLLDGESIKYEDITGGYPTYYGVRVGVNKSGNAMMVGNTKRYGRTEEEEEKAVEDFNNDYYNTVDLLESGKIDLNKYMIGEDQIDINNPNLIKEILNLMPVISDGSKHSEQYAKELLENINGIGADEVYEEFKKQSMKQKPQSQPQPAMSKPEKPSRFTRNPDWKDYDINDELMKNLRDYEYYSNIEDINKSLENEKSWKSKMQNERFRTQDDFDKIDRRISLLSDPRIQKYVNDRNTFNKQFENDYNEYKPIAKQAIIAKLLSDQDLYDTESDSNTTNDLYDQVNSDFAKKYGYERTNYGDMFKPGRRGFDNFLGDEERITMQDGSRARRRKLNKDKYLANLLDQGEITLADLRRLLK